MASRDIFRVFDSLNYIDNLKFGIDAVRALTPYPTSNICQVLCRVCSTYLGPPPFA